MENIDLKFYSTGEYFTPYLRDIITEGRWKPAYDFLLAGGAPESLIRKFFMFEAEFIGDTREDTFAVQVCEPTGEFAENLLTGLRTVLEANDRDFTLLEIKHAAKKIPDLEYLLKVITYEEIIALLWRKVIEIEGYMIATPKMMISTKESDWSLANGVIIPTGEYILCEYMAHVSLYSVLAQLGFASDSDWTSDDKCIHVSSRSIHGTVANVLRDPELYIGRYRDREDKAEVTDAQLDTLFMLRAHVDDIYGEHNAKLVDHIRQYIVEKENKGGKYGNLAFLRRFYPDIKIPLFLTELLPASYEKTFMRTSPRKSLPGLLNSRLMNNNQHDFNLMRNFMQHEFEKVKDLRTENELHWFFQEYLEGPNGVAHFYEKGDFEYALSEKRGDVVKGKKSKTTLNPKGYNRLRGIASTLHNDLDKSIQLEYVVFNDEIYVVQLRILENNPETTVLAGKPEGVIYKGRTFSRGRKKVKVKDILIVDSEADSKELLGKQALIVREDPSFSHILALSKALKIPSMYAVGNIDLSQYDEVEFVAYNKEAYICKPTKD